MFGFDMKFSTSSSLLFLLFLTGSFAQPAPPPTHYESVYLPIGAGEPQTDRSEFEGFGKFINAFGSCGTFQSNTVNEAFKDDLAANNDFQVLCEPSPTRVLIAPDTKDFGGFQRDFLKECELFSCSANPYPAKGDTVKITNSNGDVDAHFPTPENETRSVCSTFQPEYTPGSPVKVIFANEADCFGSIPSLKQSTQPDPNVPNQKLHQVPRWLPKDQQRLNVRPFFFGDEKSENLERVPFIFNEASNPEPKVTFATCDTACDQGRVVKITMTPNSYQSMVFIDPSKCDSFRVCFNPEHFSNDARLPICRPDYTIDVLFKNGVVIWGKKGRASLIELMSPYMDKSKTLAIEFGYGIQRKNGQTGEFYIGNDHREFVTSDSDSYQAKDASELAFFFPNSECLRRKAGIFSKNIAHGKLLFLGADPKAAGVIQGVKFNQQGDPITVAAKEAATTTTREVIHNLVVTTTPMAPRIIAEAGALSVIETDEATNEAVFITGKWWTWGIYIGFVIGTLLTLGLGSGLFYVLRRTVFSVWYRGMYKRYGCDASGTTGGLTGVGFGDTTAGAETIGTTMGESLMGTTAGGTTAGTTGGTTGGSTSSNNSIAM